MEIGRVRVWVNLSTHVILLHQSNNGISTLHRDYLTCCILIRAIKLSRGGTRAFLVVVRRVGFSIDFWQFYLDPVIMYLKDIRIILLRLTTNPSINAYIHITVSPTAQYQCTQINLHLPLLTHCPPSPSLMQQHRDWRKLDRHLSRCSLGHQVKRDPFLLRCQW